VARRAVINLKDARPLWSIPDAHAAHIAAAFPVDWQVTRVDAAADGRGDGSGVTPEALAAAPGTEVWIGYGLPEEILAAAGDTLRWAHTGTAGIAALLYPRMLDADLLLTNSAGVHAPAMAETVIAMALHFARGFDITLRAQQAARWDPAPFDEDTDRVRELAGATLGLVGMGGIGREVARRAVALGMHVIAVRRHDRPAPAGVQLLRGDDALGTLLDRSDIVVLALPATSETRGLIDAAALRRMRSDAVLINVARGDVLDEDALLHALRSGALRGAGLDVFRTEPLPADSLFWSLPNVLITPHVSAATSRFWERESELIIENIGRYLDGTPLRNVVDRQAGY
jgi:phosphoglycerate dehydrogenase-like enzyme